MYEQGKPDRIEAGPPLNEAGKLRVRLVEDMLHRPPSAEGHYDGHYEDAELRLCAERRFRQAQDQQARKMEAIGQLAAGIAHEINTPTQYVGDNLHFLQDFVADLLDVLAGVDEVLRLAKQESLTPDSLRKLEDCLARADLPYLRREVPQAVSQSLSGIEQITHIVQAMRDFSHPGGEDKVPVDLNKAVRNCLLVSRYVWKQMAQVKCDLDPDLPSVPALPDEINPVFLNLIVNAAHAIEDAGLPEQIGTIKITTRRREGCAEVRIQDSGTGIPPQIQGRIFDPFFTTKTAGRGTGQGLAICKEAVVGKHQGSLSFKTALGKGTTFIVRLPLSDPSNQEDCDAEDFDRR